MRETRLILDAASRLFTRGQVVVLATVVRVSGSAYRRPGARMLIAANGETFGSVSGGCLESDLTRKAWWRTQDGPSVVVYDSTADADTAWRLGLGCNGVVHVLLERVSRNRPGPLAFIGRCVAENRNGVIATVFRADPETGVALGSRLTLDADGMALSPFSRDLADCIRRDAAACMASGRGMTIAYQRPAGEIELAFEIVRPPIRLVVFGGGFDVPPVVDAAKALGWLTTVVSRRRTASCGNDAIIATADMACDHLRPDARTAAVVMNHNVAADRDALAALLRSGAGYIGVLGPKVRTEQMLEELEHGGSGRLYAPVGLDIGADSPEEIAAAIVAQVIAVFEGRRGGHLRDRQGPIHHLEPETILDTR